NFVINEDSQYMPGFGNVSLSSKSADNIALAINNIPFPKQSQTVKLNVNATANGTYNLNMTEIKSIPQIYKIWLMDAYAKDSLDMRHNSTYSFQITKSDTNSYGSRRFSLVIGQDPALAIQLIDFAASKVKNDVQLIWKTINEENYTYFTVERSTDNGVNFNVLGGFTSDAMGTYSFLDKNPFPTAAKSASNMYRLKIEDLNGTISYSKVVMLTHSNSDKDFGDNNDNNVSVYPNPATSIINLNISQNNNIKLNNINLIYDMKIMNSYGLVVKTAVFSQSKWQNDISSLMPGTYFILITNNNDKSIVGNTKFVKL
ncbi:MAG: Cadherin-like beta sandwich domain protein, partial [Mucilaginibacter sp.]|nr:Cadherin-like beta sandwich domain protein [Mucilaginibacter sp.]